MKRPTTPPTPRGSIRADELLLLSEASHRLNWGVKTARKAKRDGLRTSTYGRSDYVLGADLLAFFRAQTDVQAAGGER